MGMRNPVVKKRSLPAIAAALLICCSVFGEAETENGDCSQAGEAESCTCGNGLDGERFCLSNGTFTDCRCSDGQSSSCRSPGAEAACACKGGAIGIRFCLRDGSYSPCDCSNVTAGTAAGAAGSDSETGSSGGDSGGCPSGFNCVEMQGFQICGDSNGIPPLCSADPDCADAGLTGAMCTDPGVGYKVCIQLCG